MNTSGCQPCDQTSPGNSNPSDCNPCCQVISQESVSSQIANLIAALFGPITATIDPQTGRTVWNQPCSPYDTGLTCIPRLANEGLVCYLLRLISIMGLIPSGAWSNLVTYCSAMMVGYNGSLYYALKTNINVIPGTDSTIWAYILTAPQGVPGNPGAPGPSGAGSAINFAVRTITVGDTAQNTDAIIFCNNPAPINLNFSAIAGYLAGKWFEIIAQGADVVNLVANGAEVIGLPNVAATGTFTIIPGETAQIRSKSITKWYIT